LEAKIEKEQKDRADKQRREAEEAKGANKEADTQHKAIGARHGLQTLTLPTFEGHWRVTSCEEGGQSSNAHVGEAVEITKNGELYSVSGPNEQLQMTAFRSTGASLTGTLEPTLDQLQRWFSNIPAPKSAFQQAVGRTHYDSKLTLSADGLSVSAETDNWQISFTRYQTFLNTDYTFAGAERHPGYFRFTLERDPQDLANNDDHVAAGASSRLTAKTENSEIDEARRANIETLKPYNNSRWKCTSIVSSLPDGGKARLSRKDLEKSEISAYIEIHGDQVEGYSVYDGPKGALLNQHPEWAGKRVPSGDFTCTLKGRSFERSFDRGSAKGTIASDGATFQITSEAGKYSQQSIYERIDKSR
jgi:hypothetical protein